MAIRHGESHVGDGIGYRAIWHIQGMPKANYPSLLSLDLVSGAGAKTQYFFWVDSNGNFRYGNSLPAAPDTDGNVIRPAAGWNASLLDPITVATATYGVPFVITVVNAGAATVSIFNANLPFKIRIIDAWAVSTKASNSGTYKLDNGTNDITNALAYSTSDKGIARQSGIDDAYHEIAAAGSLRLINSESTDTAIVYISAIRVD